MKTLYHITLETNLFDISNNGVDPHKATGKMPVSWWVDIENIVWALAHVSARWGTPVDKLIVCQAVFDEARVTKWMLRGVYHTSQLVIPSTFWGYETFLKPEVDSINLKR